MENRYADTLLKGNQLILDLTPGNYTLRIVLANELARSKAKTVLEIGCGEGDATRYILEHDPNVRVTALDVSADMIERAKKTLVSYKGRVDFVCADALKFLDGKHNQYDAITMSWVLHNFPWQDKTKLLNAISKSLHPGGLFIEMDKAYPNDEKSSKAQLRHQCERYKHLDTRLRKDIVSHEMLDYSPKYKMTEKQTIDALKSAGFRDIGIVDRVERDIVISAIKPKR